MSKGTAWTKEDLAAKGIVSDGKGGYRVDGNRISAAAIMPLFTEHVKKIQMQPFSLVQPRPVEKKKIGRPKIDLFVKFLETMKIPKPVKEYKFCSRRWKYDYAWPEYLIALEVEGGAWTEGRHTRGQGFINDMEKYNTGTSKGWRILRRVPDELCTMETVQLLQSTISICNNGKTQQEG